MSAQEAMAQLIEASSRPDLGPQKGPLKVVRFLGELPNPKGNLKELALCQGGEWAAVTCPKGIDLWTFWLSSVGELVKV